MRADYRTIDTREKLFAAARAYFMQAKGMCADVFDAEETAGSCLYRLNGRDSAHTCVAGLFLPDELWGEDYNGSTLRFLRETLEHDHGADHPFVMWLGEHYDDLRALQEIHDDPHNWMASGALTPKAWATFDDLATPGAAS